MPIIFNNFGGEDIMELNLERTNDHIELVDNFNAAMKSFVNIVNEISYCQIKIEGSKLAIKELEKEKLNYLQSIEQCNRRISEYEKAIDYISKKYTGEEQQSLTSSVKEQLESLKETQERFNRAVEKCEQMLLANNGELEKLQIQLQALNEKNEQFSLNFQAASRDLQEYTGLDLYAEFIKNKFASIQKSDFSSVHLSDFKLHFAGEESMEYE